MSIKTSKNNGKITNRNHSINVVDVMKYWNIICETLDDLQERGELLSWTPDDLFYEVIDSGLNVIEEWRRRGDGIFEEGYSP